MKVLHPKRGKSSPMGTMPTMTTDAKGDTKMIESLEEASTLVGNFLANEYSATPDEGVRPDRQAETTAMPYLRATVPPHIR